MVLTELEKKENKAKYMKEYYEKNQDYQKKYRQTPEGKKVYLKCMDHCHATGMYRNTVCKSCNNKIPRIKQ